MTGLGVEPALVAGSVGVIAFYWLLGEPSSALAGSRLTRTTEAPSRLQSEVVRTSAVANKGR